METKSIIEKLQKSSDPFEYAYTVLLPTVQREIDKSSVYGFERCSESGGYQKTIDWYSYDEYQSMLKKNPELALRVIVRTKNQR